jgi:hypothetical protein
VVRRVYVLGGISTPPAGKIAPSVHHALRYSQQTRLSQLSVNLIPLFGDSAGGFRRGGLWVQSSLEDSLFVCLGGPWGLDLVHVDGPPPQQEWEDQAHL